MRKIEIAENALENVDLPSLTQQDFLNLSSKGRNGKIVFCHGEPCFTSIDACCSAMASVLNCSKTHLRPLLDRAIEDESKLFGMYVQIHDDVCRDVERRFGSLKPTVYETLEDAAEAVKPQAQGHSLMTRMGLIMLAADKQGEAYGSVWSWHGEPDG